MTDKVQEVKEDEVEIVKIKSTDAKKLEYSVKGEKDVAEMSLEDVSKEIKDLEDLATEAQTQLARTTYPVNVVDMKTMNQLIKFTETGIPWEHKTAALLVSVYHSVKAAKVEGIDDGGNIWVFGRDAAHIYNSLLQTKGSGYHEAKNHIRLLTVIGQSVTEAMSAVADDNKILRDIHTRLSALDAQKAILLADATEVESEDVEKTHVASKELDDKIMAASKAAGEILEEAQDTTKQ